MEWRVERGIESEEWRMEWRVELRLEWRVELRLEWSVGNGEWSVECGR